MKMKSLKTHVISTIVAIVVALCVWQGFQALQREQLAAAVSLSQFQALDRLSEVTRSLQMDIQDTLKYSDFLSLVITQNPDISDAELLEYAEVAIRQNPSITGVQFAPDGIVSLVYPLQGNEPALGHNLLKDPLRRSYVQLAIESGASVLQGPVLARQGGYYIFNRKAVFIPNSNGNKFWGLTVIALDFDQIMQGYQQRLSDSNYLYSLTTSDEFNSAKLLWGDPNIDLDTALVQTVMLPHTRWELALAPKDGWSPVSNSIADKLFALLVTFMIFLLALFSTQSYMNKRRKSRTDPLTGSLNKEALQLRVEALIRRRKPFVMLLVDLNDFKAVNDTHGHYIGDRALVEICSRVRMVLRNGDDLSRFGGDEFLIVMLGEDMDTELLMERVRQQVSRPMHIEGHTMIVGSSVGCAVYDGGAASYDSLYQSADEDMYRMKNADITDRRNGVKIIEMPQAQSSVS